MDYIDQYVRPTDPALADAIDAEEDRQRNKIELIASENFTSRAVMAAQGSVLTNKYAEGYPGKRYYGGCEARRCGRTLARERLKELFTALNTPMFSPTAVPMPTWLFILPSLKPGDQVLGMNLAHGGHLTHGSPVNISGTYFNFADYGVDKETETH